MGDSKAGTNQPHAAVLATKHTMDEANLMVLGGRAMAGMVHLRWRSKGACFISTHLEFSAIDNIGDGNIVDKDDEHGRTCMTNDEATS